MDLARADVGCGARRDREEPRLHRRRQGAAVARRRRRQRPRGAAPRAGGGVGVRSAGDDPHGPDDLAAAASSWTCSSAATSSRTCSRRRRTASSTTAAASCPKCWRRGAAASGSTSATGRPAICGGTPSSAIMKAGFWPDTFSTDWNANSETTGVIDFPTACRSCSASACRSIEVIARATVNPSRDLPGVQRPRHAQRRCAGRRGGARAARRDVRVPRQLQGHDHGETAVLPGGTVLAGKRIATA